MDEESCSRELRIVIRNRKCWITDMHGCHFVAIGREAGLGSAVIQQGLAAVRASAGQVEERVQAVYLQAADHHTPQTAIVTPSWYDGRAIVEHTA